MSDGRAAAPAEPGRWSVTAAILLVAEAVAMIVVLAATGRRVVLPVEAFFTGAAGGSSGGPDLDLDLVRIADIDLGPAVVVLCLLVAASRVPALVGGRHKGRGAAPDGRHTARWVEYSLTASITVFLVAQLNGIVDVTTLVLVYAATSGMALFGLLHQRVDVRRGHPKLALCFGAGLGIVPWGIIAFQQVGAGLAGDPPSVAVRVITLVMLAFAGAFAVTQWREGGAVGGAVPASGAAAAAHGPGSRAERMHVLLSFASASVFAWAVIVAVVLPR